MTPEDCTDGAPATAAAAPSAGAAESEASVAEQSAKPVVAASDGGMERRDALKAMGTAALGLPLLEHFAAARAGAQGVPTTGQAQAPQAPVAGPRGGPWDPDLLHPTKDWPRKLRANELATLSVLCDVIIPADASSPAASAVGVPAWINEYVSAPNEGQQRDLVRVRGGLAWLNLESMRRFGKPFRQLRAGQRSGICDDICYLPKARPEFQAAARFFDLVRDLTAVGFYTSFEGMRDIGYIGNVVLPKFPEVSAEIRERLGLG